jgi:hypothetical protein
LKAQICEKIHADYGGGYCCKEKIEFKIMTGKRSGGGPKREQCFRSRPPGGDLWAAPSLNAAGLK